jgi:hypothetical protein
VVNPPLPVAAEAIARQLGGSDDIPFEDQDVVGIQEADIAFGQWVEPESAVTLVYYDAELEE